MDLINFCSIDVLTETLGKLPKCNEPPFSPPHEEPTLGPRSIVEIKNAHTQYSA